MDEAGEVQVAVDDATPKPHRLATALCSADRFECAMDWGDRLGWVIDMAGGVGRVTNEIVIGKATDYRERKGAMKAERPS